MTPRDVAPWDRQPGESSKAYEAFTVYRDLRPSTRSLVEAGRRLGKSRVLLERWSVRWRWQDRLSAWDSERSRQQLAAEVEARREMVDRHARVMVNALGQVTRRLVGDPANGIAKIDPNGLAWADLIRALDVLVKLERLSRGEADAVTDIRLVREQAVALAAAGGLPVEEVLAEVDKILAGE